MTLGRWKDGCSGRLRVTTGRRLYRNDREVPRQGQDRNVDGRRGGGTSEIVIPALLVGRERGCGVSLLSRDQTSDGPACDGNLCVCPEKIDVLGQECSTNPYCFVYVPSNDPRYGTGVIPMRPSNFLPTYISRYIDYP